MGWLRRVSSSKLLVSFAEYRLFKRSFLRERPVILRSLLIAATPQHTATHCNTLQHTATHCNTLQHTATHCNILQYIATRCNIQQHTATHCKKYAGYLFQLVPLSHLHTHTHRHRRTHVQTDRQTRFIYRHRFTCIHMYIYTYIYIYKYTHIHGHTYTKIQHMHAYTYIRSKDTFCKDLNTQTNKQIFGTFEAKNSKEFIFSCGKRCHFILRCFHLACPSLLQVFCHRYFVYFFKRGL